METAYDLSAEFCINNQHRRLSDLRNSRWLSDLFLFLSFPIHGGCGLKVRCRYMEVRMEVKWLKDDMRMNWGSSEDETIVRYSVRRGFGDEMKMKWGWDKAKMWKGWWWDDEDEIIRKWGWDEDQIGWDEDMRMRCGCDRDEMKWWKMRMNRWWDEDEMVKLCEMKMTREIRWKWDELWMRWGCHKEDQIEMIWWDQDEMKIIYAMEMSKQWDMDEMRNYRGD